jgi:hypothetical protein
VAERKLTERQQAFCRLCAEGVKPIDAAKEIGYRNAYRSAGEMLRNERIREEIVRMQNEGEKAAVQRTEGDTPAEKAEILSFLTEVMRDSEEADLKTRMKAAELLGKRESLFEKGKDGADRYRVVIVDDIP